MKVHRFKAPGMAEVQVPLKELEIGAMFRFPSPTFEEALKKPGESFHFVTGDSGAKPDAKGKPIISLDKKLIGRRDEEVMVIPHEIDIFVKPAEMVPTGESPIDDKSDTQ